MVKVFVAMCRILFATRWSSVSVNLARNKIPRDTKARQR
jgi:hypothetical protein